MKNYSMTISALLIAVILAASCKKEDSSYSPPPSEEAEMDITIDLYNNTGQDEISFILYQKNLADTNFNVVYVWRKILLVN